MAADECVAETTFPECDREAMRQKTAFQANFDKLRGGLKLEIKALNSKLYSKGLISSDVRMENDIDTTLSSIDLQLKNATKPTFAGFVQAVSDISSKTHLKTMLECQASDGSIVPHAASTSSGIINGNFLTASVLPSLKKQPSTTWQEKLELCRDSASTTSSVEKLCSVSWQQVIDEKNLVHTESGTMPVLINVSIEYVRELEEQVSELENSIKQLKREKNYNRTLVLDKHQMFQRQIVNWRKPSICFNQRMMKQMICAKH